MITKELYGTFRDAMQNEIDGYDCDEDGTKLSVEIEQGEILYEIDFCASIETSERRYDYDTPPEYTVYQDVIIHSIKAYDEDGETESGVTEDDIKSLEEELSFREVY